MRTLTLVCILFIFGATLFSLRSTFAGNQSDRATQAEARAVAHLARAGVKADRLKAKHLEVDDLGMTHVRFAQVVDGVRVYGSELITHERANRRFLEDTDGLFKGSLPDTTPNLIEPVARQIADAWFGKDGVADAELVIYPLNDAEARLAYSIDIKNTDTEMDEPRREQMFIDARTGELLDRWDNLQTAGTTGTGKGFYAGTVTGMPVDLSAGTYSLFDVVNNGKTFDFKNKTCPPLGCTSTGTLYTSTTSTFGTDGNLNNRLSIGVDAHFFAQKTLAYFFSTFARNGIDGSGNSSLSFGYMVSRTHYGRKYNNAFWDGASMTYGDGDGTTFRPFDAADVVGHEMTHGVTERTSNLEYRNESGAANESFSDIFGRVIENFVGNRTGFGGVAYPGDDWWIGEDLYLSNDPSNPARGIRNMQDPHLEGDPDHYSEKNPTTQDNGGVHTNSGIMNKVFYLLVAGGTNHADTTGTTVTGIGMTAAAEAAYYADTAFCVPADKTYAVIANRWVQAARARFGNGSANAQQTFNAWKACGVTPTVAP